MRRERRLKFVNLARKADDSPSGGVCGGEREDRMTTKKQFLDRHKRNVELAKMDAANRCVVCKRAFAETGQIVEDFCVPGKCCSDECLKTLLAGEGEAR